MPFCPLPPLQGDKGIKQTGTGNTHENDTRFFDTFSLIALSALGELTEADLNEIRLIVREEIKKETATINTKIDGLDTRLRTVEAGVAELRGRNIGFSVAQDWIVAICAVAAIVLSIIAFSFDFFQRTAYTDMKPKPQPLGCGCYHDF